MFRFSLRALFLAIAVFGMALGLALPHCRWGHLYDTKGWPRTAEGTTYSVDWMTESDPFGGHRFLHAIIRPTWVNSPPSGGGTTNPYVTPDGDGLERFPSGIYFNGELIGGYGTSRVLICLGRKNIHVVPLSPEDIRALNQVRGRTLVESKVWKERIEPEIDRLVGPYGNPDYRSWRVSRGLSEIPLGEGHKQHPDYCAWLEERERRLAHRLPANGS